MKVLSLASLELIGEYLDKNPESTALVDNFQTMYADLSLQFVDAEYDISFDNVNLLTPDDDLDEKQSDAKNSAILYQAMRSLSPAEATDERLWVTLCFGDFNQYVSSRWKMSAKGRGKNIKNHWTFQGAKPLTRDNALSRLWWMGHLASQIEGWTSEQVFEILFNNSDYRQSLVDRSGTSSNTQVVSAILAITKSAFDQNIEFKRAAFRRFMEGVNFIAGRSNLAALDITEIIKILQPIYLEAHNVNNGGVLNKVIKGIGKAFKD
jgi:hypothetical protein